MSRYQQQHTALSASGDRTLKLYPDLVWFYGFMCARVEATETYCAPMYGSSCDSGQITCTMPHTSVTAGAQANCVDTPGRWANRKCARKHRKNRCDRNKVARNCGATCGTCRG